MSRQNFLLILPLYILEGLLSFWFGFFPPVFFLIAQIYYRMSSKTVQLMGKRRHHFWKVNTAKTTVEGSVSLQNVSRNSFQILVNYFPAKIAISSKPCVRSVPATLSNGGLWCMLLFLPFPAINELAQSPASLSVLVRNSQLPWLPAAKRWCSSPQLFTRLFTKSNCLFIWAS